MNKKIRKNSQLSLILIEADNNKILGKGMQSLGVTIAKGINKLRGIKGALYKHRYHFRKIQSTRELLLRSFFSKNTPII